MIDCIIVGAGPAGLSAAHLAVSCGLTVKVLEAARTVGGRTRSAIHHDCVIDEGAAFIGSFYSETHALARTAGVTLQPRAVQPGRAGHAQYLRTCRGMVPHNLGAPSGFVRFPFLSAAEKLRIVAGCWTLAFGPPSHVAEIQTLARFDEGNGEEWGRELLGPGGFDYIVRLAVEPFFFFEPARCSSALPRALLQHALRRWELSAPVASMGSLCGRIAASLDVRTEARVCKIAPAAQGVEVVHQRGAEYARAVICAIPASAVLQMEVELEDDDRAALSEIQWAPSVRVNLGYDRRDIMHPAIVVFGGPGRHTLSSIAALSTWHPERLAAGKELVRVNFSAWRGRELLGETDECIIQAALEACEKLGFRLPDPLWASVLNWPEATVIPAPGHYRRALDFQRCSRGRLYFAGDWLTGSTIEGAVRSGITAAQRMAAELGARAPIRYS